MTEHVQDNGSTIAVEPQTQPLRGIDEPKVKKISKVFPFKLNQKDLADKAVQLGALHARLETADRVLTAAKEEYKRTAADIAVARAAAVDAIRTGSEMRDTECEEVEDFATGRVYWRRKSETASDMWEVLDERAMTPSERQMALKLSDKKGGEYEAKPEDKPVENVTELFTDAQVQAARNPEAS